MGIDESERILIGFSDYLLLEKGMSDSTIRSYLSDVRLFFSYLTDANSRIIPFSSGDIENYLKLKENCEPSTVARFLVALRGRDIRCGLPSVYRFSSHEQGLGFAHGASQRASV